MVNLMVNTLTAEQLQQRHNLFTHALLLGDRSTENSVQATPGKASASQDMQQTPQDLVFQSDSVL
jgi:hypothetical protein